MVRMGATGIEWTDVTWNPVTGCRKVSPGCQHCYAETFARRGMGPWKGRRFEDVRTHADRLDAPLRWRKPRRVFVNSMSDLFHEDVPDDFIDRVFAVMLLARRHTFQVLTKRPERMRSYVRPGARLRVTVEAGRLADDGRGSLSEPIAWPLPNVWLGVSCEDQQRAAERIPILLDTPAAVRFVSAEPLLGPIRLDWLRVKDGNLHALRGVRTDDFTSCGVPDQRTARLGWVICGGESGPGARPCAVEWVRDIRDDCTAAGVACFVKQLGAVVSHDDPDSWDEGESPWPDGTVIDDGCTPRVRLRDRKGGDMTEWPADLRVREFPAP